MYLNSSCGEKTRNSRIS